MTIKDYNDVPTNIVRKIATGGTATTFILDTRPRKTLKVFKDNKLTKMIYKMHKDYREYVRFLEGINDDSLVVPDTLYYDEKDILRAYEYPYVDGLTISSLHPKIQVESFIKALDSFKKSIEEISKYLVLHDLHHNNVVYTGKAIKLIDLDLYAINEKTREIAIYKNRAQFNRAILKNVISDVCLEVVVEDQNLRRLYMLCDDGTIDVVEFLETFKDYLEERVEPIKYLRDFGRTSKKARKW